MRLFCSVVFTILFIIVHAGDPATSARSKKAVQNVKPKLERHLSDLNIPWGAPVFIRIFKGDGLLELWVKQEARFVLFDSYPICAVSGKLGPKEKEGDMQAPEGFYAVTPDLMNPWSSYHLSFNVGYPNRYDRSLGRTGSLIMIHGNCASLGCFAMTNPKIEEIYAMVEAALKAGSKAVPVHIYPFRLTTKNLALMADSRWAPFWHNLKEGYDYFENNRLPPQVSHNKKGYRFNPTPERRGVSGSQ